MRRVIQHDDAYTAVSPTVAGPLFDRGPFDHSPAGEPSSKAQALIAALIWKHQGRDNPINIEQIGRNTDYQPRDVKAIVEELRREHLMPIGAKRDEPSGYFWIVDASDREVAAAPYRRQILTMWETLRRMDSTEHLRELREKMTVEEQNK